MARPGARSAILGHLVKPRTGTKGQAYRGLVYLWDRGSVNRSLPTVNIKVVFSFESDPEQRKEVYMAKFEAPKHLSKEARDIWKALTTEYGISDAGGLNILRVALESWDRAQAARLSIEKNTMLIVGRDGQPKPHPLLTVERDARAAFLQGLKALNLDIVPENHRIGRPGGR